MGLREFYAAVGGSAEQVMARLVSEGLIRRFLGKFTADPSYAALKEALAAGDAETAFRAAHTMKGTAANLGLDTLAAAASALTEVLRRGELPPAALVDEVDRAYALTVAAIEALGA